MRVLLVEDDSATAQSIEMMLRSESYVCDTTDMGEDGLEIGKLYDYDIIILDLVLPDADGRVLLTEWRSSHATAQIPVIVLSALDKTDNVVRCIEMGADDFLAKPFSPVILKARIGACLEKKRFRDREQAYLEEIRIEREKSERLLLNILPAPIAERLKAGSSTIADGFAEATVLFSDLVGFTKIAARVTAEELVSRLNELFQAFDSQDEACG